jgi:hypothetical protein
MTEAIPAALASKSEMTSACIVNNNVGNAIVHGAENWCRFEPADSRHGRIENDQIRMQIPSLLNGIKAIRSLAANVEFSLSIKIRVNELPYDGACRRRSGYI